ncbi:GAF domain-like protein [Lasiosphaeris hirsuta]|uniref:GAF domain-like protein n=1 Tax=Lasiosphaeris hirsuta TaxID=260670 RepID=A0AA40A3N3_9PEZI|nr:GAF domain-like protein [Lasiosphaeris hirsuta]
MTDEPGSASGLNTPDPLISDRFEYAILDDDSHGVVKGTRRAFTRCEDELIRIPGAIQAYGMLVALKRHAEGIFVPRIVSENSHYICRYQPLELFSFESFNQAMPIFQRSLFNTQLRNIRRAYDHTGKEQEPVVFAFSFFDPEGRLIPCWCAAHYLGGADLYLCEFELQDYSMHPLATPQHTEPPNRPIDTLGSDHMDVATVSSLRSKSQPFFSNPEVTLQGIDPNSSAVEIVGIATKIQKQFSGALSVDALLGAIVGVVKELSGFNRVMVYQFDQDFNGTVVAELMDPKASQDVYRGLHFPSTDIPPQARQLYMINKVRVLFDRTQQTARLVGRSASDIAVPLDLTHAYLRAMSPVHLKYLANMEVRSSMSMSLESEGNLWGLIVCHSYGPTATRVPFSIRELSYFVGVAASTCLEKLLNADKLQARRIIETLQDKKNPNECITASSDELLTLFEADCGFLVIEGEARTIGRLASYTEAVTLLQYLFFRRLSKILFSSNIPGDFKDLHYPSGFKAIAGVLYIPLSGTTDDCVVFYRRSQLREVHWAGRPSLAGKFGTLQPRNSFKKWTEVVHGTSKSWSPEQANIAAMAQLVYGSFIRVWREKEIAVKETRLKRLLLHDASHQVRTPLNAVINYLEMALEKPLEQSTKQALTASYTASKSLIYVIDDLLNLTGSTTGSIPQLCDPFDLTSCIEEALDPLKRLAREKGVEVVTRTSPGPSRYLRGDPPSLQRTVQTIVANAIEHTGSGRVLVEWAEVLRKPNNSTMRIAVTDSGPGLTERELDDMFQEFEQVPDEDFDEILGQQVALREDVLRVGVGLAFVARYVKQRSGQLKVSSTKGQGSTFAIEVPFVVASRAPSLAARRDASPLPALPMPPQRPDLIAEMTSGAVNAAVGPSGVGASPPIVVPTPNKSPMEADQMPATHYFTILIADDNIINVQILKRRLSKMGHRVLVSRDGQECFNLFVPNQATVDFVLMDLNMPIVDGWASARMIRQQEHNNPTPSRAVQSCGRTPIFAVSGMLRRGDEQRCIDAGFDGWMPKPVDMKRVATCLAGALDAGTRHMCVYDDAHFELGGWFPARELQSTTPGYYPGSWVEDPLSPWRELGEGIMDGSPSNLLDPSPRNSSVFQQPPTEQTPRGVKDEAVAQVVSVPSSESAHVATPQESAGEGVIERAAEGIAEGLPPEEVSTKGELPTKVQGVALSPTTLGNLESLGSPAPSPRQVS